jgi:sterol 22-desaturase
MASLTNATSFVSPLANADLQIPTSHSAAFLGRIAEQLNGWTIALTIVLLAVSYDQCSYKWQKYGIIGPAWKIPFMGPFLESVYPDFEKYKAKWASGELSCVSVFHK